MSLIRRIIKWIKRKFKRKNKPDLNLGQFEIDTERLSSDFEVLDKYLSFSSELLRLSLLGIAALAFLLKEMFTASQPDQINRYVAVISGSRSMRVSIVFFAIAAASALAHRYYSSDSMACQIRYLRLKKAADSDKKNDAIQKEKNSEKEKRDSLLVLGGVLLALSTISLGLGAIFLAGAVYSALAQRYH
jgi:hypothetical protein